MEIKNGPFGSGGFEKEGIESRRLHGNGHFFEGFGKDKWIVRRQDFGIEDEALLAATHEDRAYTDRTEGGQKAVHVHRPETTKRG
jgi:hypothetical protein